MNAEAIRKHIGTLWNERVIPTLCDYIRIPCKSPAFDPDWAGNGHLQAAAQMLLDWSHGAGIAELDAEIVTLPGRTPVLVCEIPASPGVEGADALLYGHYDKQPEFLPWAQGLDPWMPVLRDGRLYGRGGADDGYALFGYLSAISALQAADIPHGRCLILIEGCEESASYDLPFYMEHLSERIGKPDLVICLDAECGDYERLWLTTSLRGMVSGTLDVGVLTEGVHSGIASGIVPSSFRILRRLLERIEEAETGRLIDAVHVEIPERFRRQARDMAETLGGALISRFPWSESTRPVSETLEEVALNNSWRPALSVTGLGGAPPIEQAGNTLRPGTQAKLSLRLPPTLPAESAARTIKAALEDDPPYGAPVTFELDSAQSGWAAPATAPWLARSMEAASTAYFGASMREMGTGGSIPFMRMLGERFPKVQFLVTGVLGPHSNAHGPNEFLEIETGKRVSCCVARVLADHAATGEERPGRVSGG